MSPRENIINRGSALLVAAAFLGGCGGTPEAPGWTYTPATAAPTTTALGAQPSPTASIDHNLHPASATPSAGSTAAVDGEVAVMMTDAMRFEPEVISVVAGEAVTFVVTNLGLIPHEFFVGDADAQEHHAQEMASGDGHQHHGALRLEAGATGWITLTFERAGELLVGCHEPGHYAAGMVGRISVTE